MAERIVSSPAARFVMALVVAVLLLIVTAFTFTSHFVPQIAGRTKQTEVARDYSEDGSPIRLFAVPPYNYSYSKLFFSHMAIGGSGKFFQDEVRLSYWFPSSSSADENMALLSDLGHRMIGAQAFALLATVAGGVATIVSLMSLVAPPLLGMDVARRALIVAAAIFCLIAVALVVSGYNCTNTKLVRDAMAETPYGKWKLSTGLGFICVGFAGYVIAFVVELLSCMCVQHGCFCSCGLMESRDAWSDDSKSSRNGYNSDQFSYGTGAL